MESGLNDGLSVPFLMLFIALAMAEESTGGDWLAFAGEQIGYGALVGRRVTVATVVYAVLSLSLIRMLPVALAVTGLGMRPATVAFLGWFGPRGLASVILALVVVEEAPSLPGLAAIHLAVTVTVLLSVLAHGVSAAPLSRRYAARRFAEPTAGAVVPTPGS